MIYNVFYIHPLCLRASLLVLLCKVQKKEQTDQYAGWETWERGNRERQHTHTHSFVQCSPQPFLIDYISVETTINACIYPFVPLSILMSPLLPKTRSPHVEAVGLCNTGINY